MSSFGGKMHEYTFISIDRFDEENLTSAAYFLSHVHSDHMRGLRTREFHKRLKDGNGVKFYCSILTEAFLMEDFQDIYTNIQSYVHSLPVNESQMITVPNENAQEVNRELVVTLLPAAHCPGSVMFLFEGAEGTVLYTGDFRLDCDSVVKMKSLQNGNSIKQIRSLYLDTTFCERSAYHIPTRQQSLEALILLVREWLVLGEEYLVYLHCPSGYGYEFVFIGLFEQLNQRVHVSKKNKYASVPEIFQAVTDDPQESRIHACYEPNSNLYNWKNGEFQIPCKCEVSGTREAIVRKIKISAQYFATQMTLNENYIVDSTKKDCRVYYSTHSSLTEICNFVAHIKPEFIYPNVNPCGSSNEEVMEILRQFQSNAQSLLNNAFYPAHELFIHGKIKRPAIDLINECSSENSLVFDLDTNHSMHPQKRTRIQSTEPNRDGESTPTEVMPTSQDSTQPFTPEKNVESQESSQAVSLTSQDGKNQYVYKLNLLSQANGNNDNSPQWFFHCSLTESESDIPTIINNKEQAPLHETSKNDVIMPSTNNNGDTKMEVTDFTIATNKCLGEQQCDDHKSILNGRQSDDHDQSSSRKLREIFPELSSMTSSELVETLYPDHDIFLTAIADDNVSQSDQNERAKNIQKIEDSANASQHINLKNHVENATKNISLPETNVGSDIEHIPFTNDGSSSASGTEICKSQVIHKDDINTDSLLVPQGDDLNSRIRDDLSKEKLKCHNSPSENIEIAELQLTNGNSMTEISDDELTTLEENVIIISSDTSQDSCSDCVILEEKNTLCNIDKIINSNESGDSSIRPITEALQSLTKPHVYNKTPEKQSQESNDIDTTPDQILLCEIPVIEISDSSSDSTPDDLSPMSIFIAEENDI